MGSCVELGTVIDFGEVGSCVIDASAIFSTPTCSVATYTHFNKDDCTNEDYSPESLQSAIIVYQFFTCYKISGSTSVKMTSCVEGAVYDSSDHCSGALVDDDNYDDLLEPENCTKVDDDDKSTKDQE
jgi:hypothetical protein